MAKDKRTVAEIIKGTMRAEGGVKKAPVPAKEVLSEFFKNSLPSDTDSFSNILASLRADTKKQFKAADPNLKEPEGGSFNNCNGLWAEHIYAVTAWNTFAAINKAPDSNHLFVYVKLPSERNINTSWLSLLKDEFRHIAENISLDSSDPSVKASSHGSYRLCSSNPDAVIVKIDKDSPILSQLSLDPQCPMTDLSTIAVAKLNQIRNDLKGQLDPFENIKCFLSIKTSMRPDRRLQFLHEGNNIKATLRYLVDANNLNQKRRIKLDILDRKYFAVALGKVSQKDFDSMDAACIATLHLAPTTTIWAVDQLFSCKSPASASAQIKKMIQ